jgi:hypothetical protein
LQGAVHGALGQHPDAGLGVFERRQQGVQLVIVEAAFDADRPLAVGGQALLGSMKAVMRWAISSRFRPAAARMMASYSPASSLARRVLTLPRRSRITRSGGQRAAGTDGAGWRCRPRPLRQLVYLVEAVGNKGIARVFALADGVQAESVGELHRHVFHGVDGDVGPPFQHGSFQLLDEQPLAADLGERGIEDLVTLGAHGHQFDLQLRIQGFQPIFESWPATGPVGSFEWQFSGFGLPYQSVVSSLEGKRSYHPLQGLSWRSPQKRGQAQKRGLKIIFIQPTIDFNLLKIKFYCFPMIPLRTCQK